MSDSVIHVDFTKKNDDDDPFDACSCGEVWVEIVSTFDGNPPAVVFEHGQITGWHGNFHCVACRADRTGEILQAVADSVKE